MRDIERERQINLLERRWRAVRDSRSWVDADPLARQILPLLSKDDYRLYTYRTYLCDSLLYQGKLDKAVASYLKLVPGGKLEETAAYVGLARIAAERHDFTRGTQWLDRYARAPGVGCGSCSEWRRYHAYMLRTVWKAARQPASDAPLRQIIAGRGYTPLQMEYKKVPASMQLESAAQEARLILGERLLRQKRVPEAKLLFGELMTKVPKESRSEDERFILAEFHLKRLG